MSKFQAFVCLKEGDDRVLVMSDGAEIADCVTGLQVGTLLLIVTSVPVRYKKRMKTTNNDKICTCRDDTTCRRHPTYTISRALVMSYNTSMIRLDDYDVRYSYVTMWSNHDRATYLDNSGNLHTYYEDIRTRKLVTKIVKNNVQSMSSIDGYIISDGKVMHVSDRCFALYDIPSGGDWKILYKNVIWNNNTIRISGHPDIMIPDGIEFCGMVEWRDMEVIGLNVKPIYPHNYIIYVINHSGYVIWISHNGQLKYTNQRALGLVVGAYTYSHNFHYFPVDEDLNVMFTDQTLRSELVGKIDFSVCPWSRS